MSVDVVDLRAFYATPLGLAASASLRHVLTQLGVLGEDVPVIGIGYPLPLFEGMDPPRSACALMPARQGALHWPEGKPARVALIEEEELPLANASAECVVMLHLLENTGDPLLALNEAWRVLVPEGRLIVIATNRRGFWARSEHTPFGAGRPFSRTQLAQLLREARLTPLRWQEAMVFPPMRSARMAKLCSMTEATGRRLWPVFGGVHVVEAVKRLYQGVPVAAKRSKRVLVPVLSPQGIGNAAAPRMPDADAEQ